jgi:hypothetical protein
VALIVFTVGWKIEKVPEPIDEIKQNIVQFLKENGFAVRVNEQILNYMPIIEGSKNACRLSVAKLTNDASNRELIKSQFSDVDHLFVVFEGRVYQEQPVFLTVVSYLESRFLRELGLRRHITPVLAVGETSSCAAELLPWSDLSLKNERPVVNAATTTRE